MYRDFDGVTREVVAEGRTKSAAESNLLRKLRERSARRQGASLKATDRFALAADVWFRQVSEMVVDGRRSEGTRDAYRRMLDNQVLPALGELRVGEITTPLLDSVLTSIKTHVGPPTDKSCRSVISGILGLAVRHGAIRTNPVRDANSILSGPKRRPRALSETERREWFAMLANDPKAIEADLPDLTAFLLATGARIGEALGLTWSDVDLHGGQVKITHQVTRITGRGLVRTGTKSSAGERVLTLPERCTTMLVERFNNGVHAEEPVFCNALGGFRDPSNVRRDLRRARSPLGSRARQELGSMLAKARRTARHSRADVAARMAWSKSRVELVETGRVHLDIDEAVALADLYGLSAGQQAELIALAHEAAAPSSADALDWITSHSFRKTTATILDDAGQSARQIADQLGHARPSLTQDVYMGRRAKNPAAGAALEDALRPHVSGSKSEGFPEGSRGPPRRPDALTCTMVRHQGLEPRTR